MQKTWINNICRLEWEKLYRMPIFYILFFMCIVCNAFLLWDGLGYKIEAIHYGEELLADNPEEFAENYFYNYYEEIDLDAVQNYAQWEKSFPDGIQRVITDNYERLTVRAEEMSDSEKNSLSFTGANHLHDILFGSYLQALIWEGIIIIVVMVLHSTHFEKSQGTEELVLTTKTGLQLYSVKMRVAGWMALGFCTVLVLGSLIIYFALVDYSGIWDCFISSNYNAGKRIVNNLYLISYPYITWIPMTILEYLAASIGIMFLIFVFMILFTGVMAQSTRNSMVALVSMIAILAVTYLVGEELLIPNGMEYIIKCQPVHLIQKCGYWFMDYAPGDSYPLYEIVTMVIWIVGMGAVLCNCVTYSKKKRRNDS